MVKKDVLLPKFYPNSKVYKMTWGLMYCRYIGSKFKKERERQRWWRGDYCYRIAGTQSLSNAATQGGAFKKKKNEPLVVDPNLTNPILKPFTAPNEFSSIGYSSNWTRSIQSQRPDHTRLIRTHMWTRKRSDVNFRWWFIDVVVWQRRRSLLRVTVCSQAW